MIMIEEDGMNSGSLIPKRSCSGSDKEKRGESENSPSGFRFCPAALVLHSAFGLNLRLDFGSGTSSIRNPLDFLLVLSMENVKDRVPERRLKGGGEILDLLVVQPESQTLEFVDSEPDEACRSDLDETPGKLIFLSPNSS